MTTRRSAGGEIVPDLVTREVSLGQVLREFAEAEGEFRTSAAILRCVKCGGAVRTSPRGQMMMGPVCDCLPSFMQPSEVAHQQVQPSADQLEARARDLMERF